jgi:hypothetical protein
MNGTDSSQKKKHKWLINMLRNVSSRKQTTNAGKDAGKKKNLYIYLMGM